MENDLFDEHSKLALLIALTLGVALLILLIRKVQR